MPGGFDKTSRRERERQQATDERRERARLEPPFPGRAVPYDPTIFGSVPSAVLLDQAESQDDRAP